MTSLSSSLEPSERAKQHPHWALVERVGGSQCFHASARLREFFFYVCDCALRDAPEEATEQQIGMHVFNRRAGYNSSEDSIVRTHARGLRQKLSDYFGEEGILEEIIIEIPKGHYLPAFRPRAVPVPGHAVPGTALLPGVELPQIPPDVHAAPLRRRSIIWIVASVLAIVLLLLGVGIWQLAGPPEFARSPVQRFWASFLADNSSLVIYSNARFVGDSTTGLRYAPASSDDPSRATGDFVDTYTGIGELASVYDLTRLFDQFHSSFVLKRSLLVTWDQARASNLIFIGSVAENSSLRLLPSTMNFTLMAGNGFAGIVNHHPAPGEAALYSRPESKPDHPMSRDYAILALLPGLQQGRHILVFSGLTTLGTQSAMEFACHNDTVERLLRVVGGPHGEVRPFEAVLETSIVGGVPMETHMVAVHVE